MNCLHCEDPYDKNVPLLKCGCYLCPSCYCRFKSSKINNCLCGKKLIRGGRKYKEIINIVN